MKRTSRLYFSSGKGRKGGSETGMGEEEEEVKSKGVTECDKETRKLTDLVSHFLEFVLRTTHDDHIQSSPGQLEMKQPSNHVCN